MQSITEFDLQLITEYDDPFFFYVRTNLEHQLLFFFSNVNKTSISNMHVSIYNCLVSSYVSIFFYCIIALLNTEYLITKSKYFDTVYNLEYRFCICENIIISNFSRYMLYNFFLYYSELHTNSSIHIISHIMLKYYILIKKNITKIRNNLYNLRYVKNRLNKKINTYFENRCFCAEQLNSRRTKLMDEICAKISIFSILQKYVFLKKIY